MKNILITGANGQLGNEMRLLSSENNQYNYFFTDVQELDICDEQCYTEVCYRKPNRCNCELCSTIQL